jgi:hypothetical protein
MASLPQPQPQSGSQPPADPPQPQQSQRITPMGRWILEAGVFLILIGAAIWIKSWLLNNQSPMATVMTILFGTVGLIIAFVQVHYLFFPNSSGGHPTPAWLTSLYGNSRLVKSIDFGIPTIGIICIVGILLLPLFPPSPPPTVLFTLTPSPTLSPTPTPRTGTPTNPSVPFAVYPNYNPSGYVGDTGDIKVAMLPSLVRFTYTVKGQGPYEWDWTYLDNGSLNPNPSKFAGVLYLNPPDNWGKDPHGGFDLRGRKTLTWKAHSLNGSVNVEFVIGGIVWQWDRQTHTKVAVPYPDSLPRFSLGIKKLTPTWQTFTYDLSALPTEYLRAVVAAFGCVISWDSNAVQGTGSGQPQTFIVEIQDVFYL